MTTTTTLSSPLFRYSIFYFQHISKGKWHDFHNVQSAASKLTENKTALKHCTDTEICPNVSNPLTLLLRSVKRPDGKLITPNVSNTKTIWMSTVSDHAFLVAGSHLWNSLPPDINSAPITGTVLGRQNTSPNNLPPNMAANDLRCSEMPHYCRVVIRV